MTVEAKSCDNFNELLKRIDARSPDVISRLQENLKKELNNVPRQYDLLGRLSYWTCERLYLWPNNGTSDTNELQSK